MGSLVSSVLGMDNGMKAGKQAVEAGDRYAKDVYFRPYTMTTGTGVTKYTPDSYESKLNQPFYDAQTAGLSTATNILGQLQQFSPAQRQQQIFQEQAALLQPEFQRQQARMESGAFGSGRLGLRLAGQGAGAGSGMVQPDAFGLAQSQQQTLGALAAGSRQQAVEEATALGDIGIKALAGSLGVSELEASLMKLGLDAESARAMAAASAGQVGTSGYTTQAQAGMAQDKAMGSLWGGIASGVTGYLLK